jgi:peptidase S41-like protein
MARKSLAAVQRGVLLADAVPSAKARRTTRHGKRRGRALRSLKGPFLSPGALTKNERLRLLNGIRKVIEGAFTHLPLKRARYGFDPVQRLNILCSQIEQLADDAFHFELADIITRLRDFHTTYAGPVALESKVAALPFLVEAIGPIDNATYMVTKVGRRLAASFKPGVTLEYWNGVPIARAVQRHSDRGQGGRPDTAHAWAVENLTLRSLQYGPPPDEQWVVIGYRTEGGQAREITIDWKIVDPAAVAPMAGAAPEGARGKAARRTRAVNPAAQAIRQAKMLLFAPQALRGQQARTRKRRRRSQKHAEPTIIKTNLTQSLKAMTLPGPGGPYGYLRIWAFDDLPEKFVPELIRLLDYMPDNGLIIDIRGNPGGYIWAAEFALQLFTPNPIEPTRFSALATPFMREIAVIGDVAEDLLPWKTSLDAAVRNGELYAQPIPISDVESCNALGTHYGGPVMLVGDSSTYSAGDLFSAGFVDNEIGPFICVGTATGAGGANVWDYEELRVAVRGSPSALPKLPDGIGMTFSFRRATRARANEGVPIEDVGISGIPYAMTKNDVLNDNEDLLARCISQLRTIRA